MIPPGDFNDPAFMAGLLHPWTPARTTAFQLGPVGIQDPSQGSLVQMWTAEVVGNTILLSSPNTPPFVAYTFTEIITDISVAFDQNANYILSFMGQSGGSFLYWWNPLIPGYDTLSLSGVFSPCVTLDDGRAFNVSNSDVVLAYSSVGLLRYRLQRDRYTIEYTPLSDVTGLPIPCNVVYHVSMSNGMRLIFIYGNDIDFDGQPSYVYLGPLIMKQQVLMQKTPAEDLPITFNFEHTMLFGDYIVSAAVNIVVDSGEDPDTSGMLSGSPTFTDTTVTQQVVNGVPGQIYRIAMSVGTHNNCIYVTEGLLYVNDSPAISPP